MPIQILSEETINKIAAGEVVERPANVIKELIENSLDAGAKKIEVEIKGSGRRFIRVRDDGKGMTREDLTLAVTRHATSKIKSFNDLETLSTMGFRGEALPSIAAVSRMTMQSHPALAGGGWELKIAGGVINESRAFAGAVGTTVEVNDLFFNTPARAKFLKSDLTERHHIIRIIEEIALSRFDVSFLLKSENKTVINAPAAKTALERISDILGINFSSTLIEAQAVHPNISLTAYVTKSENSAATRNFQFLFVNNRPVQLGRNLTHALYEAYRENLPQGRHPGAVIYLDINPSQVDVNIHPTKREVRFSSEKEIHEFLYRAIKTAIVRPIDISLEIKPACVKESNPNEYKSVSFPGLTGESIDCTVLPRRQAGKPCNDTKTAPLFINRDTHPIGQIFGLYALAQHEDDFLIIDQHAACERVRYEKYLSQWEQKRIAVQQLLLPITFELPSSAFNLLKENLQIFRDTGWEIEEFGANSFRVTALPHVLGDANVKNIIDDIIVSLSEDTKLDLERKRDKIIRAACRSSIKANEKISGLEINRLLKDLFLCKTPYTCPHGRPTLIKLSREELDKKFGRK